MDADHADELMACTVKTASLELLLDRLGDEPVLLLGGHPHGGQFTTAIAAMLRYVGDPAQIFWYVSGSDPLDLRPGGEPSGAGYVVDARHIEENVALDQVIGHLRTWRGQCRIIVLAPSAWPSHDLLIDHAPPPLEEVFGAHMAYRLRLRGVSHCDEQVAKARVHEHVQEELQAHPRPRAAVSLAHRMATVIAAGRPLEEALADMPERLRKEVRESLREAAPRRARCFLISSAVLHGLPAVVVVKRALLLATCIEQELARQNTAERPREALVWEEFSTWAQKAKVTAEPGRGGEGRTVRLMRRGYAGITLRTVWEEQPTIHEPLLDWLRDLSEDEDWRIRMKAAYAIGLLATFDFAVVDERFLKRWSDSKRPSHHDLAAWTLNTAAEDPDITPRVHERLRQWAKGSRACRSIVARAYGSWIGAIWIDEALDAMEKVAGSEDRQLQMAVARSISHICQPENAVKIMSRLERWAAESDDRSRRRTAGLAFIWLAAQKGRHRIHDLTSRSDAHDSIVALWLHALALGVADDALSDREPEAWALLADWVSAWDENPETRQVLQRVFSAAGPAVSHVLAFHLRYWRRLGLISPELEVHLTGRLERSRTCHSPGSSNTAGGAPS
ncbi:hypothetical protein [Microtetraspora niveoalba]|uniref:hypothetical protein n=1 Tax=Microtetraspora niveoalba TaxID=46175 RepID=UPI0012FB2CDC|nr:hypothetical protein [Microtetraspora niveoalba]